MNRWTLSSMLLLLTVLACVAAFAGFADTGAAIKYRKSVMALIGYHFGSMGDVVKGDKDFDPAVFQKDAEVVRSLAGLPWEASMVPGSDVGDTTLTSAALGDPDGFMAAAKAFEAAADRLNAAAGSGDLGGIKVQFGETAKTCKACHAAFRKK